MNLGQRYREAAAARIARFCNGSLFYFTAESETGKVAAMLEVIVSFCLLADPTRCTERTFVPGEALTPYQCFAGAQLQTVEWLKTHPAYRVDKWTCRRAGLEAKL